MPLANILAPELLRKAQEIEQAIGPPGQPQQPLNAGYLQAGYEKTPYDPKGLVDKPGSKSYDAGTIGGGALSSIGKMQRSGVPEQEAFARGFADSMKEKPTPYLAPTSPAAPMKLVKKGEKAGTKGRVLKLPAGEVGMNERGEGVNARGKKLGYLSDPQLVTPSGSTGIRTGDRRPSDVGLSDRDAYSTDVLKEDYGEHLKEYEDNRGEFPKGYFDGMSKTKKKNIIDAVKELQQRAKLATEGTSA